MSALAVGGIVFVCVFGGALLGMFLGRVLPRHHLSAESKDAIKVAMAMIATLAALVVGLLIASAKSSFDGKDSEFKGAATHVLLLDRTLAEYGPETKEVRDLLRRIVTLRMSQIWPQESAGMVEPNALSSGAGFEEVQRKLLDLSPQNDAQRWLKSTTLQLTLDIEGARWLVVEQSGSSIQWPFLVTLVFWLAMIFASFGLFAPPNGSVIAALLVCALSVAAAIYLIVEMDQPYGGLIQISSAPLRTVLNQLGQQ
jgi:hypothetical protein